LSKNLPYFFQAKHAASRIFQSFSKSISNCITIEPELDKRPIFLKHLSLLNAYLYSNGGVCSSARLVRGIQMKNGSQQRRKTPMTNPKVAAALEYS
jgi:hypothetical protein